MLFYTISFHNEPPSPRSFPSTLSLTRILIHFSLHPCTQYILFMCHVPFLKLSSILSTSERAGQ